jgi:acetylornithine deacetylase/succinyl-diaminopimelate desuccinylase-like protein
MDVVSAGDLRRWGKPPFDGVVEDGVLHGRGTADSKGMLAGMLEALQAILESGVKLKGDLYFVAAVDDETAGRYGLRYAFETGQVPSEYVILGEGTQFGIGHIFKGRIWIELEVLGKAAHSAFPETGVNAIQKAAKVISALYAVDFGSHPILGSSTKNIGRIQGGQQLNVLPESCKFVIDIRWGPPLTSRDIRRMVEETLARIQADDPELCLAEWNVLEERDPLEFPAASPLIEAIKAAGQRVLNRDIPSSGWYSSGEVFHINRLGRLKTGVLMGPGIPWSAHAPNESIQIEDLVAGAKVYALTALELCGVSET